MSEVYNINLDVNLLMNQTKDLAGYNQNISNDIFSVASISNEIKNNWTNTEVSSDVSQSLSKIEECINKYNDVIDPILTKFVETMNVLCIAHQKTADKTVDV